VEQFLVESADAGVGFVVVGHVAFDLAAVSAGVVAVVVAGVGVAVPSLSNLLVAKCGTLSGALSDALFGALYGTAPLPLLSVARQGARGAGCRNAFYFPFGEGQHSFSCQFRRSTTARNSGPFRRPV
jgi:hypothetical protein